MGALATSYGIAAAVGGPSPGRFVDICGRTRVLLVGAAASTNGCFRLAGTSLERGVLAAVAITLAGSFAPALELCPRSPWTAVVDA